MRRPTARLLFGALLAVFAVLPLAWRLSPLTAWVDFDALAATTLRLREAPWLPWAALLAYVPAGFVAFPVTVLVAATGFVFGPVEGSFIALGGSLASASAGFAVGRRLGRAAVEQRLGPRARRLNAWLAHRGLVPMVVLRLLPVAPFTVVNVALGASRLGWRDFLLGTLLGMAPGIVLLCLLADRLGQALARPGPRTLAGAALAGLALVGLAAALQRRLAAREKTAS